IGVLVGPVLGGYLSENYSYAFAFLVCAFISMVPILITNKIPVIKKVSKEENRSLLSSIALLKVPILKKMLLFSALVMYSRDIFIAYFPLLGKHLNLSESTIGWILAIQGFAIILVRFFLPKLIDLLGK